MTAEQLAALLDLLPEPWRSGRVWTSERDGATVVGVSIMVEPEQGAEHG